MTRFKILGAPGGCSEEPRSSALKIYKKRATERNGVCNCDWCAAFTDVSPAYGEKLCSSCRRIAAKRRQCERKGASFDAEVYREEERFARELGSRYRAAIEGANGLEVEYAFSAVSRALCHKDLFRNYATYFNNRFDSEQQKCLIDLLFRMIRTVEARRRWTKAAYSPRLEWTPPGLAAKVNLQP